VYAGYFWSELIDAVATFLSVLAVCSVPWIITMIIGFVHRKGFFWPDDLQVFNRGERGGRYWFWHGINLRASGPWLLAATVGMFFTNTAWFTGPGTDLTDGTDVGFAVSGAIVAVLYPLMLKLFPEPRELFPDEGEASFERAYATVEPQAEPADPPPALEPA
jgi:purine-cytosine permease-like protein